MYKNIGCIFIFLCVTLPSTSFAAALNKYSIPQQTTIAPIQIQKKASSEQISDDVYIRFKEKIKNYDQAEKNKLVEHFRKKIKIARQENNKSAVAYYQRLIGILKTTH